MKNETTLILGVAFVLVAFIFSNNQSWSVAIAVTVIMVVLIMVLGKASKYLPKVMKELRQIFRV